MIRDEETETKRFESLFYGADTPMVLFKGPEIIVEMFNSKYHELYQYHDILGKPFFDVVSELRVSQFPQILKNVYETGETFVSFQGLAKIQNRKTGEIEERYFDTTFSRIKFSDDDVFRILAIPREVTERVRYQKQLEISLKELEEEREFRELFISTLTHDLRTPLAIIKLSAEILSRRVWEPHEVQALAERMITSVNNTDRMIGDLLDVDRIRAGEWLNINAHQACLKNIILELLKNIEKIYPNRIEFKTTESKFDGDWDSVAISRMIENLINNAIKYGANESKVALSLDLENDNQVRISVHNLGNPIPLDEQSGIFTKHRRATHALESGKKGWGIGLALVKGLAEAHQGQVTLVSNEELGTTFCVTLPLKRASL